MNILKGNGGYHIVNRFGEIISENFLYKNIKKPSPNFYLCTTKEGLPHIYGEEGLCFKGYRIEYLELGRFNISLNNMIYNICIHNDEFRFNNYDIEDKIDPYLIEHRYSSILENYECPILRHYIPKSTYLTIDNRIHNIRNNNVFIKSKELAGIINDFYYKDKKGYIRSFNGKYISTEKVNYSNSGSYHSRNNYYIFKDNNIFIMPYKVKKDYIVDMYSNIYKLNNLNYEVHNNQIIIDKEIVVINKYLIQFKSI